MARFSTILVTALLIAVFMGHAYMPGVAHAEGPEVPTVPGATMYPGPLHIELELASEDKGAHESQTTRLVSPSPSIEDFGVQPHLRFVEEKKFTLSLINAARNEAGLAPIVLGTNNAAQIYAQSMLHNCYSAHWGLDGLKPYMRYSLAGDLQPNSENVSGHNYCLTEEEKPRYRPISSVEDELGDHMAGLMDSPGHRDNILNPWHKKVNLGVSWDTHQMWTVQHFEGDYVRCSQSTITQGPTLHVSCTVINGAMFAPDLAQQIFYDPPPHNLTRGQLARTYCYDSGRNVALLRKRPREGYRYSTNDAEATYSGCPNPYNVDPNAPPPTSPEEDRRLYELARDTLIIPETYRVPWIDGEQSVNANAFSIVSNIGSVIEEHENGVYTVRVWGRIDGEPLVVLNVPIFHGVEPPDTYNVSPGSPAQEPCSDGTAVADKSNTGLIADCNALLAARDVLATPLQSGEPWLNWSADTPITGWYGFGEDSLEGSPLRVTKLYLNGLWLDGSIPSGLSSLTKLKELHLHDNELSGSIPPELGNLSALTRLNLENNDLSGPIPPQLRGMSNMRVLLLGDNNLNGGVPAELGNLSPNPPKEGVGSVS